MSNALQQEQRYGACYHLLLGDGW